MELFLRADETFPKSPQGSVPFIFISSFAFEHFQKMSEPFLSNNNFCFFH